MSQGLDFESIMMALQRYWAEQGCLIWQPYYTQVGAGTMNPATFLRVLGPEPWRVAYVEPSVRPDDGRYGENPNRLQQHYQFQVILKPDPGNPQELFLRSLVALGIDPRHHDIRFVEDNWESPALSAWGLGWEVWMDGLEITQFTYFQQAGGQELHPVAVEITYGLERITMALQRVSSFRDIRWSPMRTYGDVNLEAEQEHSKYYFEVAGVERLREMYRLYEEEALSALDQGLILPAYDYLLKCSHTFNVMDARGAVGFTERQALFGRMRDLARRIAQQYTTYRESLGFPWLGTELPPEGEQEAPAVTAAAEEASSAPAPFVLEIGTEELPAADLSAALDQLTNRFPALLGELRLEHGALRIGGTPRRLVVMVEDLAPRQAERTLEVKGPAEAAAYDGEGHPTRAAEGFARSRGVDVAALQVRTLEGGRYVVATVHEAGRPAVEVLAEALPRLVLGLRFERSMRWNANEVSFSRPIRWLLALYGGQVVPLSVAGISSGRRTRLLRLHEPEEVEVATPEEHRAALAQAGIVVDPVERRALIARQVRALMNGEGGVDSLEDALLDEVTNLVEAPTALVGHFDPSYLRLPPEVLVSVMEKYQRYFPVRDAEGKLLPSFIVVRNGDGQFVDEVAEGNERVIAARYADADFFIHNDLRHKLEDFLPKLQTLTFQVKLGSMWDKTQRIQRISDGLVERMAVAEPEAGVTRRAALLCKADLASEMVVEMTSLSGVMGRYYALHTGEGEAVAQAIYEHTLPRFSGDELPSALPGLIVGLADRLDSLAGLFAVGLGPSGTKDPFALRRAALGLVQNLLAWQLDFDLRDGLALAAAGLPVEASAEGLEQSFQFVVGRLRALLIDQGYRYDVVDAVLAAQGGNPSAAERAARELSTWVSRDDWHDILPAFARCVRIIRDQPRQYTVDPKTFAEPMERDLYEALTQAEAAPRRAGSVDDFLGAFLPMIPTINRFFDEVLVMAEDAVVRENRLALLQRVAALAKGVADFSLLEGF
jgi:glycyl-tRNA synthetase